MHFAGLKRLVDVLQHLEHLLHFLCHRLNLLVCSLQGGIVVFVGKQFGVDGLAKACRHLLGARPVHVFDKKVARHSPQGRIALQNLRHGIHRLLALGHVAWASGHYNVVFAHRRVVNLLDDNARLIDNLLDRLWLAWIDFHHAGFVIDANDAGNPLSVVDFRDQIDQLTGDIPHGTRQIVHIMVGSYVCLMLTRQNSLARAFVGRLTKGRIILSSGCFNVLRSAQFGLYEARLREWGRCPLRERQNGPLAVCNVRIDLQIRPVLRVGRLPLELIPLELTAVTDKRCLGRQRKHLCFLGCPIIIHPLGILGVTHDARDEDATIHLKLVTHHADHRDPLPCPLALFQHLETVGFHPHDALAVYLTLTHGCQAHRTHGLVLRRTLERSLVARIQVQRVLLVVDVEILGDADRVLGDPLTDVLVADALRHDGRQRRGVRVEPLVLFLHQVFSDEAPLSVRAARVLDQRIHVDRETVADAGYLDVLIEAVLVAVLCQDADVALAVGDLVLAGGVVGYVRVRVHLDVAHHAVQHLGDLNVGLIVDGDDLAAGAVLALLVRHLTDVLRQLVDGQARSRVDGLALHRATGRQHVLRPLPLVVRRTRHEPQIVQLVLARLRVRANGLLQPVTHQRHRVAVVALVRAAARRHLACATNSCRVLVDCCHYFFLTAAGLALFASRLTLYAMATACFTGLPAATSALMFLRNACFDVDFTRGMVSTSTV